MAERPQEVRERHGEIKGKLERLVGWVVVGRLRRNREVVMGWREAEEHKRNDVREKENILRKTLFIRCFQKKFNALRHQFSLSEAFTKIIN